MRRVHIIGGKNHGKTTLTCELVAEFRRRGMRVGTIKHTHHHHELDTRGKDSHRHRESGSTVVGILSRSMNAVFWPNDYGQRVEESPRTDERYAAFEPVFGSCDLVIVEGDTQAVAPKFEVWRAELGTDPVAEQVDNIRAIVTDDVTSSTVSTVPRSDVPALADLVLQTLDLHSA